MNTTLTAPTTSTGRPRTKGLLTAREKEVMRFIGEGLGSKEIANKLFVSKRTIDFHLSNIFAKLEVNNRFKAHVAVVERGLLEEEKANV